MAHPLPFVKPGSVSGCKAYLTSLIGEAEQPDALIQTGVAAIDAALPWGGLPRGLHEIAGPFGDAAAIGFVLSLLRQRAGSILWCRSRVAVLESGGVYGPGIAEFGVSPDRLILIEGEKPADLLWAMEEGLRSKRLAAIVGEGVAIDLTASRRLQLAAEAANGLALVVPMAAADAALPSLAAMTRWHAVSVAGIAEAGGPGQPRWSLELRRCRGGGQPQNWMVEWDDAALSLDLVAPMADRPLAATG